jgi:hypothetical protein
MRSARFVIAFLLLAGNSYAQETRPQIDQATLEARIENLETQLDRIERLLETAAKERSAAATDDALAPIMVRLDAIEEKLGQISQLDQNQYVPSLAAMDKSPALRQDVFRATNGTFEVQNDMTVWMGVRLNGQRWRFPPGVSRIHIPFGVVQVELVDGGDRYTFQQDDWRIVDGRHLLKMGITDRVPIQE